MHSTSEAPNPPTSLQSESQSCKRICGLCPQHPGHHCRCCCCWHSSQSTAQIHTHCTAANTASMQLSPLLLLALAQHGRCGVGGRPTANHRGLFIKGSSPTQPHESSSRPNLGTDMLRSSSHEPFWLQRGVLGNYTCSLNEAHDAKEADSCT